MARCERSRPNRDIVVYKRHRFKDGVCEACGQKQVARMRKEKRNG